LEFFLEFFTNLEFFGLPSPKKVIHEDCVKGKVIL